MEEVGRAGMDQWQELEVLAVADHGTGQVDDKDLAMAATEERQEALSRNHAADMAHSSEGSPEPAVAQSEAEAHMGPVED